MRLLQLTDLRRCYLCVGNCDSQCNRRWWRWELAGRVPTDAWSWRTLHCRPSHV